MADWRVTELMEHLVAVYGTLKRGGSNSHLLEGSTLLGEDVLTELTLYDLGSYPGALIQPSSGVTIEVYSVSHTTLQRLDILEAFLPESPDSSMYLRQKRHTRHGEAWIYIYNQPVEPHQIITSGSW